MGRIRAPCCDHQEGLKKGPWNIAEDLKLIAYIQKNGHDNWRALPKKAGLSRCGKSCRLRWINYLNPDIKRGNFSEEEEEAIITLHKSLGNKWAKIASHLPGRTDNEIKNIWNTYIKKRLGEEKYSSTNRRNKSIIAQSEDQAQSNYMSNDIWEEDPLEGLREILDDPNMILSRILEDENDQQYSTTIISKEPDNEGDWVAYLENVLGLKDINFGDDANILAVDLDPVATYFWD